MQCVKVEKVFKKYREHENILNGVDFSVDFGKIFVLVGASGSGKTTLLHCLLGVNRIDSGKIRIFGKEVEHGKPNELASLIGYMPQELSLVQCLTIFETLQYFANLQLMNKTAFAKRFDMIFKFLELPDRQSLVKNLSGGEQRRVSLAVAIIHDPKLLILDEPTVGLDFLLRNKIWNFFHEETTKNNLTILMTTHYLNEAERANRCAFLQNGVLSANDSASNIISNLNVERIEDAYYELRVTGRVLSTTENPYAEGYEDHLEFEECKRTKTIRYQVIKAILKKECILTIRYPLSFITIFFLGICTILLAHAATGRLPNNLKIGVIDGDNLDQYQQDFLNFIDDVEFITYKSYQSATKDYMSGKLFAILQISPKFSSLLLNYNENSYNIDYVEVLLDYSKYPFVLFMKDKIATAFIKFIRSKSKDFNLGGLYLVKPIRFEDSTREWLQHGRFISQLVKLAIIIPFLLMLHCSLHIVAENRGEGSWRRTLLSGVNFSEMIAAFTIQSFFYAFIYTIEMIICIFCLIGFQNLRVLLVASLIIFDSANSGFMLGFLCSIVCDTIVLSACLGVSINLSCFMLTGLIWPLEGISKYLQPVAYAFPTTMPSLFLSSIIQNDSTFWKLNTGLATLLSVFTWKAIVIVFFITIARRKKFREYNLNH